MRSHAQNPLPEPLGGGRFRVHFASRDDLNRSRGGWFEVDLADPFRVLAVSTEPSLDLGELGAFDAAGAMPSTIVPVRGARRMYYTGWSRGVDVPFTFFIGLAIAEGASAFRRVSRAPILGRNAHDPFLTGAPWVLVEDGVYRMWYISGTGWEPAGADGKPKHYYTIKHALSRDGLAWETSDHLCIPYGPEEHAIARPVVFMDGGRYHMWFTFRGGDNTYRVGTAESDDGINWRRDPEPLGIDVSSAGWDASMICYASPIEYEGARYALYNGNDYGRTGIGLATWVE